MFIRINTVNTRKEVSQPIRLLDHLTLLHSEWPKLYGVWAVLSAIGLNTENENS